jgi:predicted ATP-grasp superfamily ATP-dependent carboligase
MGGALVIGGDSRALGIARSLGRRGIPVWAFDEGDYLLARRSRYVARSLPWPAGDEESQARHVSALAREHGLDGWTLFATSDETAALVARHHELLAASYRLTTPPWAQTRLAYDKRLTYSVAGDIGVPAPWTRYPVDRDEVEQLDPPFPCILKPASKQGLNRFTHDKAWKVADREELLARYDEACGMVGAEHVMVQELVPGGGESQFSFGAACRDGQPVASIVARRTRQYPVTFGHSSSFVETVENDAVEREARKLLGAMRYTGLVEVEFKLDSRSGEYKVLDVNPRLWTWFTLGGRAGVDFPYVGWRISQGEPVEEVRARTGVRWVRMGTDVLAATAQIRSGDLSVSRYVRSLRPPVQFAVFATDDPRPLATAVPSLVSRMARRAPTLLRRGA